MASNTEIRVQQKGTLYELLIIKAINKKAGNKVEGLDNLIRKTIATMEQEDVAWVEKQVAEIHP